MSVKRYTPTQCCQRDGTYVSYTDFEAERQRADVAEIAAKSYKNIAEAGAKELAALKGDQVPFGYVEHQAAVKVVKGETRFAALTMEPKGDKCLPLFTTPQKPVVLPERIANINLRSPLEVEDMWIARFKAAIGAAGGIVKDGE